MQKKNQSPGLAAAVSDAGHINISRGVAGGTAITSQGRAKKRARRAKGAIQDTMQPGTSASGSRKGTLTEHESADAESNIQTRFSLFHPYARSVALCGDFNDWSPTATPMTPHADGQWDITVSLSAGRHEYKFVIDGEWLPDLEAEEHVPNRFGTLNSARKVG